MPTSYLSWLKYAVEVSEYLFANVTVTRVSNQDDVAETE